MKADDYVREVKAFLAHPPKLSAIYEDAPPERADELADAKDIAADVVRRLLGEAKNLAEARRAQTDDAILAAFREARQKWRAICSRMKDPVFVEPIFDVVLKHVDPRLASLLATRR